MDLLIVESPAKAKTIGKYLGKNFKVISSYGHVRGLASEEGAVKPDAGFAMVYKASEKAAKQMQEIEAAAKRCKALYLATDPDREGEAIAWHIVEMLRQANAIKPEVPVSRVVFHEITKKAVLEALKHPGKLNLNLIEAQRTRQAMDWLVGFTLSPVLWSKIPGGRGVASKTGQKNKTALSAGRVQSVALRLVCEREEEREAFLTQEYWSILALCKRGTSNFTAMLSHLNGQKLEKFSITASEQAQEAVALMSGLTYTVKDVEKKAVRRRPSAPFTTSTMLQEAARKLGFSAKRTAQVAQRLYEGMDIGGENVGLITYMRTDSVSISGEARQEASDFISKQYGKDFLPPNPREYKTKTKNAQEAHEAIRPTNVNYTPDYVRQYIENDQYRLYELIWRRLVSSQMADAELEATVISIGDDAGKITLRATGSVITFEGFLKVYREDNDDEPSSDDGDNARLPAMKVGDGIDVEQITPRQHFTQPPPRYTDASLVKKMEELGIGRPSTYPTIIAILQDRGYVEMEKRAFVPVLRGRVVNALLTSFFHRYVEYTFTADLENELDDIANGERQLLTVLQSFWYPFKERTDGVMEYPRQEVIATIEQKLLSSMFHTPESRKCPKCEDGMLGLKFGRYGMFVGCSNYPTCNYTKEATTSERAADGEVATEQKSDVAEYPRVLGIDAETEVSIRKGPYGIYVQLDKTPPKRTGLPQGVNPAQVTLEYALGLLSLPRVVGMHPESSMPVRAGLGKFGPYVEHDGKYTSIRGQDPIAITLEAAIAALARPKAAGTRRTTATKASTAAKPRKKTSASTKKK